METVLIADDEVNIREGLKIIKMCIRDRHIE